MQKVGWFRQRSHYRGRGCYCLTHVRPNVYLGVVIILAMIVDMVIAGIFGYFIPLAVKIPWGSCLVSTVFLTTY